MDLLKVYDCLPHNLLIAKLECYGVDKANLGILLDYLTRRKQRTRQVHHLASGVILIKVCCKG